MQNLFEHIVLSIFMIVNSVEYFFEISFKTVEPYICKYAGIIYVDLLTAILSNTTLIA